MSLIVFFVLTALAASGGILFKPGQPYEALNKPAWTPPNLAFPIAWTILYIMIAIAGWLVWRAEGFGLAIGLWAVQLVLNAVWSWIFFGLRNIAAALWDIVVLLVTIAFFVLAAWPVSMTAAVLFLPYLAWVAFATALNWKILTLNRA